MGDKIGKTIFRVHDYAEKTTCEVTKKGIYGNVNFNPEVRQSCQTVLDTPYIGTYKTSVISYGRFEFGEDWKTKELSLAEGLSFEQYVDGAPNNEMWWMTCKFLNKLPVRKTIKHLRTLIKKDVILPEKQ